jgi:hypothetical protein
MTIAEDASEDGVLALLEANASEGRPLRSTALPSALQNVLDGERPSSSFQGMKELYGLPAGNLRRRLFDVFLRGRLLKQASQLRVSTKSTRSEIGPAAQTRTAGIRILRRASRGRHSGEATTSKFNIE